MKFKFQILTLILVSTFFLSGCANMQVLEVPPGNAGFGINGAFASFNLIGNPTILASSGDVLLGTVVTGDINSTHVLDGVYWEIAETDKFQIYINFTLTGIAEQFRLVGRYEGNPSHDVKLYIWDYDIIDWTAVTVEDNDFISSAVDSDFVFMLASNNYSYNNITQMKVEHISNPVASHDFYIDYTDIIQSSFIFPEPGVRYNISNVNKDLTQNMEVNGTTGMVIATIYGNYSAKACVSFLGSENTEYACDLYKNDIVEDIGFSRSFGDNPGTGSACASGLLNLAVNDSLNWKCAASTHDAFMSVFKGHFIVTRLN